MSYFSDVGMKPAEILIPAEGVDLSKWAVIACDQYTSQSEYWEGVENYVSDSPSTLRMVYPECYAESRPIDIAAIHGYMSRYRKDVLTRKFEGMVLVERETGKGKRLGLVAAFDLEDYDYTPGAKTLIRATEGTVVERLPPRMAIRRKAEIEVPHVMLLIDDKKKSVVEPLYAARDTLRPLYDFELMRGSGRIRGWAVENDAQLSSLSEALSSLKEESEGFLYAVGDGNHSFAAAKACWLEIKKTLSAEEIENHPMRYAMAEIVNLYDEALVFEPIHRAVYGANGGDITLDFILHCRARGLSVVPCQPERAHLYMLDNPLHIENTNNPLPVALVQEFLDEWLRFHPQAGIDYIHGLDNLNSLNAARIRLTAIDKNGLFPYVRKTGVLPRKAFSMGEADDKRFYLECRALCR